MKKKRTLGDELKEFVLVFLLFFAIIGFVITCSFLLFFSTVHLQEDEVRRIAPLVFGNVLVLAAIFTVFDMVRRRITVQRPVEEIQRILDQIRKGDLSARITHSSLLGSGNQFDEISESINLMAKELAGVETLRNDFISNVSHELKTPLTVIRNYAAMLQDEDISENTRMEYARAISYASGRLTDLITNILKLNKLENQQIYPEITEYNLSEQLCECLLNFENVLEEKHLNVENKMQEDVIIRADGELLMLVWNNLFSNAVKFTPKGGTVSISLKEEGEFVEVCVSDTGCGMSPETGKHIFEKFYQGDTSHSVQGNGLGLALVKRVVDITRGEIHVTSVLGEGTSFTVRFRRAGNE